MDAIDLADILLLQFAHPTHSNDHLIISYSNDRLIVKQNNKKRKRLVQPRQALEGRPVKSFFDFNGRTEATRGARRWSWIKKSS
ncbi:hypothetical protein J7E32_10075 [Bacillus sp. ISL-55]|nr:hypothetical protein [Bacillus sp. ISL-55]